MIRCLCACVALLALSQVPALPFVNLDFDAAITNEISSEPFEARSYPSGFGRVEDLLPGWTVKFKDRIQSSVLLNAHPAGANFVTVVSQEAVADYIEFFPGRVFRGRGLTTGYGLFVNATDPPYLITQRGDIPVNARLLSVNRFVAPGMRFEIRMDGIMVQENSIDAARIKETDISQFAGKNVELELKFYLAGDTEGFYGPSVGVDYISFRADLGLRITRMLPSEGMSGRVELHFTSEPSQDYFVEFQESLGAPWQVLPDAPHNSGLVVDTSANPQRFYRVRSVAKTAGMINIADPSR